MKPGHEDGVVGAMRMSHAHASESPGAGARAVHRRDDRLLERADREYVRVVRRAQAVADVRHVGELRQVLPGARSRGRRR